jgi:large subunit ribosomal protein L5
MKKFVDLKDSINADLQKKFNYQNTMMIPKLTKIVVNMGVGEAVRDKKYLETAFNEMTLITGQKPIYTVAKKSNAAFKIREGMNIGCKVTLRKSRMLDFLEKLVIIALPRSKEFRGFSSGNFDGRGNMSFGIKEQVCFLEIDYDKVDNIMGMDISIVTTANTDEEAKELLKGYKLPFIN